MTTYDISECAKRIAGWIIKTPLLEVEDLSQQTGSKVYLKLEGTQRTGAFKYRGALNYMMSLDRAEAATGVITASSGNHGLGMSLAGQQLGIKCTVVMPQSAPQVKQERAKGYGATVILHGNTYDDAQEYASRLAQKQGRLYVPSFNHPAIIEGQGTALKEILEEVPQVDVVFSPVGGGGLISGLLLAKEELGAATEIVGVEPLGAASMQASVQAGCPKTLAEMATIADGVAVATPGDITFGIVKRLKPQILSVSDDDILAAQRSLLHGPKLIAEGAGAVSVAGMLASKELNKGKTLVCLISGSNVDLTALTALI